jgi:hypothetical protein
VTMVLAATSWVAVVGAVTGVVALVITLVRWLQEGPRLHVVFGVHEEQTSQYVRPVSTIRIVNGGGLPAYISMTSASSISCLGSSACRFCARGPTGPLADARSAVSHVAPPTRSAEPPLTPRSKVVSIRANSRAARCRR